MGNIVVFPLYSARNKTLLPDTDSALGSLIIIEDHGGQTASISVGVQVQIQVVLLTAALGLVVG